MAISGSGPVQGNSRKQFPLQIKLDGGPKILTPTESGGARLVSINSLNADPLTLRSSRSDSRFIVGQQGRTARVVLGDVKPLDVFSVSPLGESKLPPLSDFANYYKTPEPDVRLSLFDTADPFMNSFDQRGDRGLRLLLPQSRGGRLQLGGTNSRASLIPFGNDRGRLEILPLDGNQPLRFGQDGRLDFRGIALKPREDTITFGDLGPFSMRKPVVLGEKRDRLERHAPVDYTQFLNSPAPRSFAFATNAVAQGRPQAVDQVRKLAIGDMGAAAMFAGDAERAFGEKLDAQQVRRGGVEALAHNPEPNNLDYQIFEGALLSSKEPHKEYPQASLALARGIAFDHGGTREHMRAALRSEELPVEAKRTAAGFLGAGFIAFQDADVKALENAAVKSGDAKIRENATYSLMSGLDWRVKEPHPGVDRALESAHLADSKREGGGSKKLRNQIEQTRLGVFKQAKGSEKDRLADSLAQSQNSDNTRVEVFAHIHREKGSGERGQEAVKMARSFTEPAARNRLLIGHASDQFQAENDHLAGQLNTAEATPESKQALRLLANSPKETIRPAAFEKAKEFTKEHGTLDDRRAILDKMDDGPISRDDLARAGEAVKGAITKAVTDAEDGDLKRLAKLYQARSLVQGEYKNKAYKGSLDRINDEITALQKKDSVQKQFADIAAKARAEAFKGRNPGGEQAAYISSDKFIDKLEVAGPKLSKSLLQAEMMKLQSLAPEKAQQAADDLTRKLTERQGKKNWEQMDEQTRAEMVQKGLLTVRDSLKGDDSKEGQALSQALSVGGTGNKVALKLAQTMTEVSKDTGKISSVGKALKNLTKQAQQLQNAYDSGDSKLIKDLTEKFGDIKVLHKTTNLLRNMEANGKLGTFGAAVGVHSIVTGGLKFNDLQSSVNSAGTLGSVASGADDVLKLSGWLAGKAGMGGSALTKAGTALGGKMAFKMLGPLGDSLNAVSTGGKAWEQFAGGDNGAGAVSTLATIGYTGAAATGLYAIAGPVAATGPVGWIALGLGVGAWGLMSIFGESDQEALLRRGVEDANGRPMRLMG